MKKVYILLCFISFFSATFAQRAADYSFSRRVGIYTPVNDTVATRLTIVESDDNVSATQNIGFTFVYEGINYTQFKMSSNGFITFNNAITNSLLANDIEADNATARPIIAPLWDDLHGASVSKISRAVYQLTGTAPNRVLTVEWRHFRWNFQATNTTISFQVKLYETSNAIDFVYRKEAVLATGPTASIGITGATGNGPGTYLSVQSVDNATVSSTTPQNRITTKPADNQVFTFTPPAPCMGAPMPGSTLTTSATTCAGGMVVLSLQNTKTPGVTYQWVSSTNGTTYTPIGGATMASYTATVSASTFYKCRVTCTATGNVGESAPILISVVPCNYTTAYTTSSPYSSIEATGTVAEFNGSAGDDNTTTNIPIPFSFVFKGSSYNFVNACTNGWLAFGGTSNTSSTNTLANTTNGPANMLAPCWDDLAVTNINEFGLNTSFFYTTTGTAPNRIFIAEWKRLERIGNNNANLNFQVRLFETSNKVEFSYGTMNGFNGTTNTIYSYSLGLRSGADYLSLQNANSNFFSATAAADALAVLPACNSKYSFTPNQTLVTGTAPAATAPVNDNAAQAIVLPVNAMPCSNFCGNVYSNENATPSVALGVCVNTMPGIADDDIWFRFTATNPTATITAIPAGGFNAVVQLFSDQGTTSVSCVNAADSGRAEVINATGLIPGSIYYIRVYHALNGAGATPQIAICVSNVQPIPANNEICTAVSLPVATTCNPVAGTTIAATPSTVSEAACFVADDDVWYSFTATSTKHSVNVSCDSGFNAAVQILSSANNLCTGTLQRFDCYNIQGLGVAENFTFNTFVPGKTYFLRIYHAPAGAGSGKFSICVTAPIPACVSNIYPAGNDVNVPALPTFKWKATENAESYDVYVGTTNPPTTLIGNTTADSLALTTTNLLVNATQYFWYVVPKNVNGMPANCGATNTTSFTTGSIPTACPSYVYPLNGAVNVPMNPVVLFEWQPVPFATSYDFYIETVNPPTVNLLNTKNSMQGLMGFQTEQTYYWYVVPRNEFGAAMGCSSNVNAYTVAKACIPSYFEGCIGNNIVDFELKGESSTAITETNAGCTPYPNYIDQTLNSNVNLMAGKAYVGSFKTPNASNYFSIYIDYNNNGGFEENERVLNTLKTKGADITTFYSFLVDATAPLGTHRMRVRNIESAVAPQFATDACANYNKGEAKDYTITIVPSGAAYTVSNTAPDSCSALAFTTIDAASYNNTELVPILDISGGLVAAINANGNSLGTITPSLYRNTGAVRQYAPNQKYLDRNITLNTLSNPETSTPTTVRLYFTAAEYTALRTADPSISSVSTLGALKTQSLCSGVYDELGAFISQTGNGMIGSDFYINVPVSTFSTFFIQNSPVILPITIEYFKGQKNGLMNNLDWKLSCTNEPRLTVVLERSETASNFRLLYTQQITEARCLQSFSYKDATPLVGANYYRLKIISPDGSIRYSQVILLMNGANGNDFISLMPNPVVNNAVLLIETATAGTVNLMITDMAGKILSNTNSNTIAGKNNIEVKMANLKSGTYVMAVTNAIGTRTTLKFVKF